MPIAWKQWEFNGTVNTLVRSKDVTHGQFRRQVDHEKQEIVVRTSNKKYFKRPGCVQTSIFATLAEQPMRRLGLKQYKSGNLDWKSA